MRTNDRPASYGNTGTIQDVTNAEADDLIKKLRAGEITAADSYGETVLRAVKFVLAGGGPSSDLTLLYDADGDAVGGFYSYYEPNGVAVVDIDQRDAELLHEALKN